jgi:hypothetical protein
MRPDKQNKNAPNKDAFFVEKLNDISYGKPSAGLTPLKASQSFNPTNIRTNIEETKNRLSDLAEKWKGVNSVKGFLTDLWDALGVLESNSGQRHGGNPSRYAAFEIAEGVIVTIRASAHNADASNYKKPGNINGESNISIVLQKRWHKNRLSLKGYLTNGKYVDTTCAAIVHESPNNGEKGS